MSRLEILKTHLTNTTSQAYQDLFDELIELLEQSLRALEEDEFPILRQRIREALSK